MSTALLIALSLVAQAAPAQTPNRDLSAQVKQLVEQLDHQSQADRDAAEKRLKELGADVLPLLPAITPRTPAEVKERLGRVRKDLEAALSAANAQPSRVTLQGTMTAAAAIQALTRQTGNQFAGEDGGDRQVQVDLSQVPFWQAFDAISDQAKLEINAYGGEPNRLVLMPREETTADRSGRGAYSGVFRLEAVRMESRRDLRNPAVNALRLTLGIAWEPRVTPISIRQPVDQIQAVDDLGNSLQIRDEESRPVLSATAESGMSAVELGIPLTLPDRKAKQVKSIRGSFTALVPGKLETFEFTSLETARDTEQLRAGVAVIVERVRQNGDLYEVRLRVRYEQAGNALESHRGWIFDNPTYMMTPAGEKLECLGANEGGREENEVGLVLLFDLPKGPKGHKFVYQTPATMLQIPITYELQNIDLP